MVSRQCARAPPGPPGGGVVTQLLQPARDVPLQRLDRLPAFAQYPPTVATPVALVVSVAWVTEPAPEPTANVTTAPAIGAPEESVSTTVGRIAVAVPARALWPSPASVVRMPGSAQPKML